MAQLLGNVAVGSTVYLNENSSPQPYLVVHQGLPSSMYDASCNGTWLLRQDIKTNASWDNEGKNEYIYASLISRLQSEYFGYIMGYDASIESVVKTVKIPYCVGNRSSQVMSGANGYPCQLFFLSGYEVGFTQSNYSTIPVDGAKLSYFISGTSGNANNKRIANFNASASYWWLRSPDTSTRDRSWDISPDGNGGDDSVSVPYGVRPAMVMPQGLVVDDSNNITSAQGPWPLPTISTLTAPSLAMIGQSIPLSWTSVSVSGYDVTYQLQRNVNNGGWQNVGSATAQTSYTDMAQTGWTQVQYQVAAIVDEFAGDYTQSDVIPVSDPQALVISGQDSNLGTITSNIAYTISSNTGNPISLTRTVNGAQVVTLTVNSGFAYSIPIADLPTGTGTIQITASIESNSKTVTQTRTWTYYKTPINIPSTGGIAQLTQNGQNIWPVTVPDAVEAPVYLGGNLNAALNKLGQAALYTKIGSPKYNQVTVDLSKVSVGDEVLLPENDVMVPHIVVHIGNPDTSIYDSSCDGVWLLRKNIITDGPWSNGSVNTFSNSAIITTMQSYFTNYSEEVQSAIKNVKIPYCIGGGNNTVNNLSNGFSCKIFPLSIYEIGTNLENVTSFTSPIDGKVLQYFEDVNLATNYNNKLFAKQDGYTIYSNWYTRSVPSNNSQSSVVVDFTGGVSSGLSTNEFGYRPAFIMPATFNQTYYVDSSNNIHPAQEYTQGGSITDVFGYDVPIAQSESGTYVGTGTYGSGNQNSISLSFTPKFVCITNQIDSSKRAFLPYGGYGVCWTQNTITSSAISAYGLATSWGTNEISWYNSSSAIQQMNESGDTYQYTAFG